MIYWTLGPEHAGAGPLANVAARRAVAHAVDYDGLIQGLLGGFAVRPASFLPIGMSNAGSTKEFADQHGFKEDLDAARGFLKEAGVPNGFQFDLSYGTSTFAGVPYEAIAQKIKSDLARVGIVANLKPAEFTTFIAAFRAGELQSALAPWATDGPEPYLMAEAAVNRIAKRGVWTPSQALKDIVTQAAAELDPAKQKALYEQFQLGLIEQVAYIVPFQPTYRLAANDTITDVHMTAAGGFLHLQEIEAAK
jgi:peptide/nickel transport system substrate-binding protein